MLGLKCVAGLPQSGTMAFTERHNVSLEWESIV